MTLEVSVIRKRKDFIELEFSGVDFGVLDGLQEVLNRDQRVEYAGAHVKHPLSGKIAFVLKTKEGVDVDSVLEQGLDELKKIGKDVREKLESTM